MITYAYSIKGRGADDNTWSHEGRVSVESAGRFMDAVNEAMRESFMAITQGKAVFGNPGVGCRGPYRLTQLLIAEEVQ